MVECLTRHPEAAGSSLTGVTGLWSLSKTHLSLLSTGSTQEDRPCLTERLLMGRKESNQTNKLICPGFLVAESHSPLSQHYQEVIKEEYFCIKSVKHDNKYKYLLVKVVTST